MTIQHWRRNIALRLVMLEHEEGIVAKSLYLSAGWSQSRWQRAKFSPNPPFELVVAMHRLLGFPPTSTILFTGTAADVVDAPIDRECFSRPQRTRRLKNRGDRS